MLFAREVWTELPNALKSSLNSVHVVDRVASTQDVAAMIKLSARDWLVCVALDQYEGKGRLGREWHSSCGQLAMSWRGRLKETPSLGLVGLAFSLAVIDAFGVFGFQGLSLKWPNDLVIENQKVGGVIVEVIPSSVTGYDLVIGVGLNVLSQNIPNNSTSFDKHMQVIPTLSAIIAQILMTWDKWKVHLQSKEGCVLIQSAWLSKAVWLHQQVFVISQENTIAGELLGITEAGLLRLLTVNGEMNFAVGDVSLRLPC